MSLRVKFSLYLACTITILFGAVAVAFEFHALRPVHPAWFLFFGMALLITLVGIFDRLLLSRIQMKLNALDALPDPLFISGKDGGILFTSAEAVKLTRYVEKNGLVGKPMNSVVVEKDEEAEPPSLSPESGHIFEAFVQRADQSLIPVEINQEVFVSGEPLTISIVRDITKRKAVEARLVKMAYYDSQTALPNRYYFMEELEKELRKVRENPLYTFCVVFLNMEKFKPLEQLAPRAADEAIVEVVKRVSSITEGFASIFRVGGNEFSIIMRGTNSKDYIDSLLQRIRRLLNNPMQIEGKTFFPSATFGVVLDIRDSNDAAQVMSLATDAIAAGKKSGTEAITYISAAEGTEILRRQIRNSLMAAQADMRRGLASLEFVPHFQPIYHLSPSRLAGFEALARWNHPNGVMASDVFVHHAEEADLISKIDKNVISKTINITKKWTEAYPDMPFFVSVNVSGASLKDPYFVSFILGRLKDAGLDSKYFVLEVTERVLIDNFEDAAEKLSLLSDHGIMVALDDFGTGYSSLQYVSRLPLSYIKIDASFIGQLFLSQKAMLMVKSIINMSAMLGIGVVAEGVETVQQLEWLAEANKNTKVQGYFFSAPEPQEGAEHLLADAHALHGVMPM